MVWGVSVKRSVVATSRRTVRRALTWRPKQRSSETLDISSLISPLRYDVRIRADFFTLVGARDPKEPLVQLVAVARQSPYARWFERVAMDRFRPWVLEDRELLEGQFAERVDKARRLYWSFMDSGFDARSPIVLRRTTTPTLADSGAVIQPRLHLADGGHRLALLLQSGGVAAPHTYVVDPRATQVMDNTVRLFGPADAQSPAYLNFLASGYLSSPHPDFTRSADLLEAVTQARGVPAGEELRGLIQAHARVWEHGPATMSHDSAGQSGSTKNAAG